MKTKSDWEKKQLNKLEGMMIKMSHLTGQHYKDKYWESIVKACVLDLWLYFTDILEKQLQQARQEGIEEEIKEVDTFRVRLEGTEEMVSLDHLLFIFDEFISELKKKKELNEKTK